MRYHLACLTFFLLVQLLPASGQDFVVLDRGGKPYSPGHTFSAGDHIEIHAGATVTLLTSSGAVIRLVGPHAGRLSLPNDNRAGAPRALGLLATMLDSAARKSPSLAATRGMGLTDKTTGPDRAGSLRTIDADTSGAQCIRTGPFELQRADAGQTWTVTLWPLVGSARKTVWPAGERSLKLADNEAIGSGSQLRIEGGKIGVTIILWRLPKEMETEAFGEVLLWMCAKGCEVQALHLAAQITSTGTAAK